MTALVPLILSFYVIIVNSETNCQWTSYTANEPLYPAGICQVTSSEAGTITSSMNMCNQDGSLTINNYASSDCTGNPTTSTPLTQQGDSTTGQPIYWQCTGGDWCDYFTITRYNPDQTCQDPTGDAYYYTFQLILNACFLESSGVYQHFTCDENDILTQKLYSDSTCTSGALTTTTTFADSTSCDISRGYYIFGGCVQETGIDLETTTTEAPSTYTPSISPTDNSGSPSKIPTVNSNAPTQGSISP
eukprot:118901_1